MGVRTGVVIAFLFDLAFTQPSYASELEATNHRFQEPLRIAVAANFKAVLDDIIDNYHPDGRITVSTGSTGALTAQVKNGAPYHLLLAADTKRPKYLENLGLTQSRKTYAYGRLAFWQPTANDVDENDLTNMSTAIAIANPRHAPYGRAAEEVLHKTGNTKLKRIKGSNVAQAFSFVQTGNAIAGLVALSQLRYNRNAEHTYWIIPADYHRTIEQQAVVIRGADHRAEDFLEFMETTEARKIIKKAGYDLADRHD